MRAMIREKPLPAEIATRRSTVGQGGHVRTLSDLEQDSAQASEYRTTTTEEYRENWRTQWIIERTLPMDDLARFRMAALGWR
jgi:hypothetical protein